MSLLGFVRAPVVWFSLVLGCAATSPDGVRERQAGGDAGTGGAAVTGAGASGSPTSIAGGAAGSTSASAGTAGVAQPGGGGGIGVASAGVAGQGGVAGTAGSGVSQGDLPAVTLFLAGDSTVSEYGAGSAQQGWGEHLDEVFVEKVMIDNQALGGRSVRSFMYVSGASGALAPRWAAIKSGLVAGDYVMIEFGINDSSVGSERFVELSEFERLLGIMVSDILAAGGVPILVTPTALQEWSGGHEGNARLGPYAAAMKNVATSHAVALADLNARSVEYLNQIGQVAAAELYFMGDKAHFTLKGGIEMATLLGQEVQGIGCPLGAYVKP